MRPAEEELDERLLFVIAMTAVVKEETEASESLVSLWLVLTNVVVRLVACEVIVENSSFEEVFPVRGEGITIRAIPTKVATKATTPKAAIVLRL